jgi:hypothetical protein
MTMDSSISRSTENVNLLLDNVDVVQVRAEIAEGLVNVGTCSLCRDH